MSLRELPGLLVVGDAALQMPRLTPLERLRGMMGRGFPEVAPLGVTTTHDPASAAEHAAREWQRQVAAGLIGG